ncbi:MAG: family 78 glycoside hydrolase catalytic domain [Candidatus Aminicenantes bacterium]|nr:family 78 glycoside hydrolase catalytic domain [Candidatus Aminicenantes bacterium]
MPSPRRFRTPGTILLGRYRGDYIQAFGVYFWKRFEIPCGARRLRIEVCGLGLCELYLDGRKVGDRVLDPPPTDYRRRALLTVHDIPAPAQGRHELTAAVGNGRHLPAFGGGDPKLYGRILADDGTGFRAIAMTDGTWRAGHGPIRENGLYFGEVYDARVRLRPAGWRRAVEVEGPRLETEAMPPIRVCRTIEPRTVQRPEAGRRIVDFGRNFSGWVRFTARGPAGSKLVIRHAELRADSGEINVSPNQGAAATDVYVFAGQGRESHEPSFTQHGFRYAEFRGPEEALKRIKIEGRFVHTDVAETGRFGCGSSIIRAIHANVRQGLLSNMMGLPTDCPQRDERHGWLADAHLAAEAAILNFDMAAFYRKFLRDIRDAQDSRGRIPDFVPAYPARLAPADPAWGSAYVTLAWLLYWYYGDTAVLEEHFDGLVRYVEFLARSARGHIIEGLGKYGDWCPPGSIAPKKTPLALTSTWSYAHDTMILARIAARLGRKADAARLEKRATAITTAFNKRFLHDGQYEVPRSSPIDRFAGQTSNALPLWLGMVPSEAKTRVFSALIKAVTEDQDYHLDTGILGTRYLLEVLSRGGRGDAAFRVVSQTSYPGWGYMIREGATTLWERWEKITSGGMNSHNHVMLASVDAWLYKFLAGIRCTAPGWRRAVIEPPNLEGCRSARASVAAGGGTLAAVWTRRKDEFTIDVRVPAGTQAEVRIPLLSARSIVENESGLVWDGRRNKPGRAGGGAVRRGDRLVLTIQDEARRLRVKK